MAIDTEDKRRSVHGYGGVSATIAPVADGAFNEGDRRHVGGTYRGVSGSGDVLTGTAGAYISATTALYAGMLTTGPISMVNTTHYESEGGLTSVGFYHETPPGLYRQLTVVATYKDTAGVASLVFGSNGSGDGQFNSPKGIAIAPDGSIYVVDGSNNRIQKFTAAGVFVTKWGSFGSGDGQFNSPKGIAIAPDGSIYVVDGSNNRIQKFTAAGVFVTKWGSFGSGDGQFGFPQGIAVAPDGTVYVADTLNDRIQVFDADGVLIAKWGYTGSDPEDFDGPEGVAVAPDGTVYVADTLNFRIQKFNADGVFYGLWGSFGTGNGQFSYLTDVAVAPDGTVYAIDYNLHRVQRFTADGVFLAKWGSSGTGAGQFQSPAGIATGPSGSVFVVDSGNRRIQKFDANLKLNTAYYAGTAMDVGPLTDSGSYYQAFFTMPDPPVGNYEVTFAAPTGPDVVLMTALSFNGVETAQTDYTGPDAGVAEQETSTTELQVSHGRAYPDYTLSLWALLYEGSTTLTAAANNFHWLTRTAGTLNNALGFRYIGAATTSSLTFGATASPAVTPRISAVLHLEAARPLLTGGATATIGPLATLYAGTIAHEGLTLYGTAGATIAPTTTLYAGSLTAVMVGEAGGYIDPTTTLYAGTLAITSGPDQLITGFFIGLGMPAALNGVYIAPTTELYAGDLWVEQFITGEEAATIAPTTTLYAGTVSEIYTATAYITAGQIYHS